MYQDGENTNEKAREDKNQFRQQDGFSSSYTPEADTERQTTSIVCQVEELVMQYVPLHCVRRLREPVRFNANPSNTITSLHD